MALFSIKGETVYVRMDRFDFNNTLCLFDF